MCGPSFAPTKYICLSCTNTFCVRCSVFEENEEKPGCTMELTVATPLPTMSAIV